MPKSIVQPYIKKEKQEFYKISLSLRNEDRYVLLKYLKCIVGTGQKIDIRVKCKLPKSTVHEPPCRYARREAGLHI